MLRLYCYLLITNINDETFAGLQRIHNSCNEFAERAEQDSADHSERNWENGLHYTQEILRHSNTTETVNLRSRNDSQVEVSGCQVSQRLCYDKTNPIDRIAKGIKVSKWKSLSECMIQSSHQVWSTAELPNLSESSLACGLWGGAQRARSLQGWAESCTRLNFSIYLYFNALCDNACGVCLCNVDC